MKLCKIKKSQMGLVFKKNNLIKTLTSAGSHIVWRGKVRIIEKGEFIPTKDLGIQELESLKSKNIAVEHVVRTGFESALFVDGVFEKLLGSGRYWFISVDKLIDIKTIDMRKHTAQITGQEILTADKVDLRINFAVTLIITDAKKALTEYDNYNNELYLLFQFALREYLSSKTLDEILEQKSNLGTQIIEIIKPREKEKG